MDNQSQNETDENERYSGEEEMEEEEEDDNQGKNWYLQKWILLALTVHYFFIRFIIAVFQGYVYRWPRI